MARKHIAKRERCGRSGGNTHRGSVILPKVSLRIVEIVTYPAQDDPIAGGLSVMLRSIVVCAAIICAATPVLATTYTRTWVSGKGVDSTDCGPIAAPCRTLQRAYFNTNAAGEINILDGAGYGSLDITKPISIVNDGAGVAGVLASAGSPGINISTGANDTVILRGLTIEGAGVGSNGIRFTNGGSLTISNVTIQGFTQTNGDGSIGNGIYLRPGSGSPRVAITNTNISDNGFAAIRYKPSSGGKIFVDRTVMANNAHGFVGDTTSSSSEPSYVMITNSVAANNNSNGFMFTGPYSQTYGSLWVHLSSSQAGNNDYGLYMGGVYAYVYLFNCSLSQNVTGDVGGSGGIISSIGNNMVPAIRGSQKSAISPY